MNSFQGLRVHLVFFCFLSICFSQAMRASETKQNDSLKTKQTSTHLQVHVHLKKQNTLAFYVHWLAGPGGVCCEGGGSAWERIHVVRKLHYNIEHAHKGLNINHGWNFWVGRALATPLIPPLTLYVAEKQSCMVIMLSAGLVTGVLRFHHIELSISTSSAYMHVHWIRSRLHVLVGTPACAGVDHHESLSMIWAGARSAMTPLECVCLSLWLSFHACTRRET